MGEGYPDRFYGETPATMDAILPTCWTHREPEPSLAGLDAAADAMGIASAGTAPPSAPSTSRSTTSSAGGRPAGPRIRGLSADLPPTDFTLGIDAPDVVAERARRASDFPALKIKCGGPSDIATLRAVRGVFDGPIRVDANTGWTPGERGRPDPELIDLGVELIEQPFPARAYRDMAWLQERSDLPIVADEAASFREDLVALDRAHRRYQREAGQGRRDRPAHRMLGRPARWASARSSAAWRRRRSRSRLRGRGLARGLGRPRRQPAPRGRSVRRHGARCRQALATLRRTGTGSPADRLTRMRVVDSRIVYRNRYPAIRNEVVSATTICRQSLDAGDRGCWSPSASGRPG